MQLLDYSYFYYTKKFKKYISCYYGSYTVTLCNSVHAQYRDVATTMYTISSCSYYHVHNVIMQLLPCAQYHHVATTMCTISSCSYYHVHNVIMQLLPCMYTMSSCSYYHVHNVIMQLPPCTQCHHVVSQLLYSMHG